MINGMLQPGEKVSNQREDNFTAAQNMIGQINVAGGQLICPNISVGSVALASMGTNTSDIAGQFWITDIEVPYNRILKNISMLSGGTATTDYWLWAIYDSFGYLLASSAVAGQLLATANSWQTQPIALTYARGTTTSTPATSVQLYGPQQYYIAVQGNGATGGALQTIPAPYQMCTGILAGTFGTIPATITVPTTFTAAKGPIVYLS